MRKKTLRFIIIIFISICSNSALAQQSVVDSLKNLLHIKTPDSTKVMVLDQLARNLMYSKPIEAFGFVQEGLRIARQAKYLKGTARAYNRLGSILRITGNYTSALQNHLESLKISESINDLDGIARAYNNIGILYSEQKESEKAIEYFKKTRQIAHEIKDKNLEQISTINIASDYNLLNKLDSARNYTLMAYNLEKVVKGDNFNVILMNLGEINYKEKKYDAAIENYESSIKTSESIEDFVSLSITYLDLAKVYADLHKTESAIYFAQKALEVGKNTKSLKNMLEASVFLSGIYENINSKIALDYYKSTASLRDSLFNSEKVKQLENISFNEQIRQKELENARIEAEHEQEHNLQLLAIAIFIIGFFLVVLQMSREEINPRVIESMGLVSLLLFFEFINLLLHPFLEKITHHNPILMLLLLVLLAAILAPLHHRLSDWVSEKLAHANTLVNGKKRKKHH